MKRCLQRPTAHLHCTKAVFGALILTLASIVEGSPSISFPINSQVPPVARVSKAFSFTFSSSSFSSTLDALQYSVLDGPGWLSLDSASRTLSGTPGAKDVGPINIRVVARDDDGSTSMPVTLIVSSDPGPGLGVSVSQQLSGSESFSYPESLLIYPSSPLSVILASDTFTNTNDKTVYYAVCANNTPLPSWITFDPKSLSLSGTTPEFTSPTELPQEFGIQVTASDVVGFAGAVATFRLVVESHKLAFRSQTSAIDVIPGEAIHFAELRAGLTLDGRPVQGGDIKQVTSNAPDWISIDNKTLEISGTPPANTISQNIYISILDRYGDNANITVRLSATTTSSSSGLIRGFIGDLKAKIGSDFIFTFNQSLITKPAPQVSLDLGTASSWLSFDPATLLMHGHVPSDSEPQTYPLKITTRDGSQNQSQDFSLTLEAGNVDIGTSTTLPGSLSGATPAPTPGSSLQSGPNTNSNADAGRQTLAAKIVLPIIAVLGLLLVVYCYRRRVAKKVSQEGYLGHARRQDRRLSEESQYSTSQLQMLERPPLLGHRRLPSKAPEIEIPSVLRASGTRRRQSRLRSPQGTVQHNARLSKHESWQSYVQRLTNPGNLQHPVKRQSLAVPDFGTMTEEEAPLRGSDSRYASRDRPYLAKRPSRIMALPSTRYSRQSTLGSSWTSISSGPMNGIGNRRISGLGHGMSLGDSAARKRHSRHRNRVSTRNTKYGLGHGRGGFTPEMSESPEFGITQKSWRTITANSRSTTSEALASKNSISSSILSMNTNPVMQNLHHIPNLNTLNNSSKVDSNPRAVSEFVRPTVKLLTSPSRPSSPTICHTNVSPRRRAYLKSRRGHGESVLFAAKPSSRLTSLSTTSHSNRDRSVIGPDLESPSEDITDHGSNKENSVDVMVHPLIRDLSRESSAQRKGQMMQRNYSASSLSHTPSVPAPLTPRKHKQSSVSPSKYGPRNGKALGISRMQSSKSSLASSTRFQSANESENASIIEVGELLEEQEGESEGERKWAHALPNPLGVHGTEGSKVQRMNWLRGNRGSMSEDAGHEEGVRIVLGERGRRPVSVDNDMDISKGAPGSRSTRLQKAYI